MKKYIVATLAAAMLVAVAPVHPAHAAPERAGRLCGHEAYKLADNHMFVADGATSEYMYSECQEQPQSAVYTIFPIEHVSTLRDIVLLEGKGKKAVIRMSWDLIAELRKDDVAFIRLNRWNDANKLIALVHNDAKKNIANMYWFDENYRNIVDALFKPINSNNK